MYTSCLNDIILVVIKTISWNVKKNRLVSKCVKVSCKNTHSDSECCENHSLVQFC